MNRSVWWAACVLAIASAMSAGQVRAQAETPVVLPAHAVVAGASIGEWTGRWWSWALSQPIAPFEDPDGRLCMVGQQGPVWFLAGTTGQFDASRECVVPLGKHLLVPVINMVFMERDSRKPLDCDGMLADAAVNNDQLVSAVVLVDGAPVADVVAHRERTEACFVLRQDAHGDIHAAADGYWLMLEPLGPGRHTISVGANYGAGDEAYGHMLQNFEYILDVGGETLLTQAFGNQRPDAG